MSEFSTLLRLLFCSAAVCLCLEAQTGYVRSGNQPIPGATVTATQGNQKVSTVTDADGHFYLPVETGDWNVEVPLYLRPTMGAGLGRQR